MYMYPIALYPKKMNNVTLYLCCLFPLQCASHLNLGHVIQVINQGDPVPPPIVFNGGAIVKMSAAAILLNIAVAVLLTILYT